MSAIAERADASHVLPIFDLRDVPSHALLEMQGQVIDLMASGASLRDTLSRIALLIEELAPPALCSILLLKPDGHHLKPAAGPSLPPAYFGAIDGVEIGACAGSCGTAAFRKTPVIVSDIASDPLWAGPRDFALSFGLRACWSMPILDSSQDVLGTIAMYYREPRAPSARDWGLLAPAARLVRLALAQNRREEALRESEARWHMAAEVTGLGTYDIDIATEKDAWSPQFKAILGLPETAATGLGILLDLMHPEDRARFLQTFSGPNSPTAFVPRKEELRIRRADTGEERIVRIQGRVLKNEEGLPSRAIGTMADITAMRRREADLAAAKDAADRANKAKSEFLASMSHELRTPLNAIIGFSDVIRHDTFGAIQPPRYRGYIEDIYDSGSHLLSLINDILDMAKIEAGKLELHRETLRLSEIVANTMRLMKPQASQAGLHLRADVPDDLELNADARAVKQLLLNLLSNAVKFTPKGGLVTTFAMRRRDGALWLGVKDTGIGMTPEGIDKALEPFGQVTSAVSVEGRGTGLGLPLVKALIEAHGATFRIESVRGQGTKVWGEFPRDAALAAPVVAS